MSLSPEYCRKQLDDIKRWTAKKKQSLDDEKEQISELQRQNPNPSFERLTNKQMRLINNNSSNTSLDDSLRTPLQILGGVGAEDGNSEVVKRPFLKRGEGLKSRYGVHPDVFKLDNLPKYKYPAKVKVKRSRKKVYSVQQQENKSERQNIQRPAPNPPVEQRFDEPPNVEDYNSDESEQEYNDVEENDSEEYVVEHPQTNVDTWGNILNTENTESVISAPKGHNESQDLHLFEYLENKVDNSSFLSNASSIVRLIGQKYKNELTLVGNSLQPPSHSREAVQIPNSSEENNDDDTESDDDESQSSRSVHVHFSDNVIVNEINDSDQENSNCEYLNASSTSTPKNKLSPPKNDTSNLSLSQVNLTSDLSTENIANVIKQLIDSKQRETEERNELLKTKIKDFEGEIQYFQTQNKILTKMKQEFELEKIETENSFAVMRQEIDDERIRIEIYLRDERNRLLEEKTKVEKQRLQPSKKEREEMTRLKEQVVVLQQDCKAKEARLMSSQSRLRAQIRNLEKQVKEKDLEIESLHKENKKLDSENLRLRRMNNNKMLAEINKNIAKLASPQDEKEKQNTKQSSAPKIQPPRKNSSSMLSSSQSESSSDEDEACESTTKSSSYNIKPSSSSATCTKANECDTHQDVTVNKKVSATVTQGLKREINNPDGSKDIWYPNGNIKKISADSMTIKMLYYNKDIKETNINEGTVRYYYAETNTWHSTYLDGLEILEFPNGQIEHRYKDGKVEVTFPNGSIRLTNPNDPEIAEEWRYANGTVAKVKINGERNIILPNGQKEIHTHDHKRREFPDGTIKIVYSDGSQETRYSNGRVRLKDCNGKLVLDSDVK